MIRVPESVFRTYGGPTTRMHGIDRGIDSADKKGSVKGWIPLGA